MVRGGDGKFNTVVNPSNSFSQCHGWSVINIFYAENKIILDFVKSTSGGNINV